MSSGSAIGAAPAPESELAKANQRLAMALRASRTCTWDVDVAGNRFILDAAWPEMLGWRPSPVSTTLRALLAATHPDDRNAILTGVRRAISGEINEYEVDHRARTATGGWIWVRSHGRVTERDTRGVATRIIGTNTDITARKLAEERVLALNANLERLVLERTEKLFESEKHHRALVESIGQGFFVNDHRGLFTYCNPAVAAVSGRTAEELLGTSVLRLVLADDRSYVVSAYRRWVAEGARDGVIEFRISTRAGRIICVEQLTTIVRDAANRVVEFRNLVRDITERKLADLRLRASEERFRALFDHSPILIALMSMPEGRVVELNAAALAAFGFTRADVLGRTSAELGVWVDRADRQWYLEHIQRTRRVTHYETRMRRKNGTEFLVLVDGALIEIEGEEYQLISMQDITAQRESEARYSLVIETTTDAIFVLDEAGYIQSANSSAARLHGYEPEELVGRNIRELDDPTDASIAALSPGWHERLLAGEKVSFELRHRRRDGAVFPLEVVAVPMKSRGETLILVTGRDITRRKRDETALRESEERFRAVFDASPIPILLSTVPDGRIREANANSLVTFGYARDEVIGRTTGELHLWLHPEQRAEFFARIAREQSVRGFEAEMQTKAGEKRIMLCSGTLLGIGGTPHFLAYAIDITALREAVLEKERIQAHAFQVQKFEALGTLAGGIAHDFNNILTGVINFTTLARDICQGSEPTATQYLDEVLVCGSRAKELVRQILLFSRAQTGQQGPMLLGPLVKESLALLRATLPASATIETAIEANTPVIQADPTQLHQLVMNLVINAGQALGGRPGRISVRVGAVTLDDTQVRALADLQAGLHVCLAVADTGCGMTEAVRARIFEPFFTTKATGEGTGLGLAVVHSVVRNHRAAIAVRTELGQGTTFEIFFPITGFSAPAVQPALHALPAGAGRHVLLVDDEKAVVFSMGLLLKRLGYRTTELCDPEEALACFAASPAAFDAIVTDLQMPRMTGLTLADRVLAIKPRIPIIMTTGFAGSLTREQIEAHGIRNVLLKPTEIIHLATVIAEALAAVG